MFDWILYSVILLYASYYDYRYLIVQNRIPTFIIVLALFFNRISFSHILGALGITLPILFYAIWKDQIGGGDVKFIFANTIYWGFEMSYIAIIVGLISVLVVMLPRRMGRKQQPNCIPLVPFLSFGYLIISILHGWKGIG